MELAKELEAFRGTNVQARAYVASFVYHKVGRQETKLASYMRYVGDHATGAPAGRAR
jgi:hypothetical protein